MLHSRAGHFAKSLRALCGHHSVPTRWGGSVCHERATFPALQRSFSSAAATSAPVGEDKIVVELQKSFDNAEKSLAHLSTAELLRANVVLASCGLAGPLVPYIDKIYGAAVAAVGPTPIHEIMRPTAFAHFCGGERVGDMLPKLSSLQEHGVGAILDYAAEAKEGEASAGNESRYDAQVALFAEAVAVAAESGSQHNCVAIKVSALCDVPLLIKASIGLAEAQRTFFRLAKASVKDPAKDEDVWGVPYVTKGLPDLVLDAEALEQGWPGHGERGVKAMDIRSTGKVDLLDWTAYWTPTRISAELADCKCAESFPVLSQEELAQLTRAEERMDAVCADARQRNVRLLVDAEWTKSQPAMDYLALRAAARYNSPSADSQVATVLQTYQCYLRGSLGRCLRDLERAEREGWAFGAKLVRGAYIVQERAEAEEAGRASPIWESLPATEANYHDVIAACLARYRHGDQVMVASHNQKSLLFTVGKMQEHALNPREAGILFAQLLGMAEGPSFALAKHGYKVFKYMPYGPLDEVVPYLLRRTQENSTLLGSPGVKKETNMLIEEACRRITGLDISWLTRGAQSS